jgi:hypothetical protein
VHYGDDFGDDGVVIAFYAPAEANDGDYTGGITLKMFDVAGWVSQEVVRNDFALVVLKLAVVADLLGPNGVVHQFTMDAPPFTLLRGDGVHVYHVVLACAKLGKDGHAWP